MKEREKGPDGRYHTVFDTPINPRMGEGRFQDTLRRFRASIASGSELESEDSTFTGDKYTDSSWGLCSCKNVADYPEVNDHTFPARIMEDMKSGYGVLLSPREAPKGAKCPMEREPRPNDLNGCFYRCRIFKPVKGTLPRGESVARTPTREEALELYDAMIADREARFGKKTTADDGEDRWEPGAGLKIRGNAL